MIRMHRELLLPPPLCVCFASAKCGYVKRTNGCLSPFATPAPSLLSILTWSMISARLLPPPAPSHGTRSPAASLDCFPVLVQYLPAAIPSCSPHTDEAAWQPTAAAPLHRGMLLSLLVSLSVTA